MKKFKLQTGHIVKVDDRDAYLLREYVWRGRAIQGRPYAMTGTSVMLSHQILPGFWFVAFRNGDTLDCRRENLIGMTKKEAGAYLHRKMSAGALAKSLLAEE